MDHFSGVIITDQYQLVRMTLISTAEASPLERCDILAELVTTFARVPVAYLRAMSVPIVSYILDFLLVRSADSVTSYTTSQVSVRS
jgi:hypothetical protein